MKDISPILISRGYSEKQAASVSKELAELDNRLVPILEAWLSDETETDYTAENLTLLNLKKKFDMTYPAALLTIDWILKDPEQALYCINRGIR